MDTFKIEAARLFSILETSASDLHASANGWLHFRRLERSGSLDEANWIGFHRVFTTGSILALTRVFEWGRSHRYVEPDTRNRYLTVKKRFDSIGLHAIRNQVIAHPLPSGRKLPLHSDEVAELLMRLAPTGFEAYFSSLSGPRGIEEGTVSRLFVDMATETMKAGGLSEDDIRRHG